MTRANEGKGDDAERALSTWLADEPDDVRWQAVIERGLDRSAQVRQRRPRFGAAGRLLGGRMQPLLAVGVTAIAAVALVGALRLLPGWWADVQPPHVGATPPPPVSVEGFVVSSLRVPAFEPVAAARTADALWVATLGANLHRLDPETGETLGTAALPGNACGPISVALDRLWVPSCATGPTLPIGPTQWSEIDTQAGSVLHSYSFPAGTGMQAVAFDGRVWLVGDAAAGRLDAINPRTRQVVEAHTFGTRLSSVAAFGESLWLGGPGSAAVIRYDPATGAEVGRLDVGASPLTMLGTGAGLFVATSDSQLARVGASGRVDLVVPLEDDILQLNLVGSTVWALTRVDILAITADGAFAARLLVGTHSVSFAPQFVGPTYAMAAGPQIWYVPPRGDMLLIGPPRG